MKHMDDLTINLTTRVTSDVERSLDWYSNSKLVALDTCDRWGAVRYGANKAFPRTKRAMALEAGSAAHEAYAAIRLFILGYYQDRTDLLEREAARLFGDRGSTILQEFDSGAQDADTVAIRMACRALECSGFQDDPDDKRRTFTNIEEGLIAYIRRYPMGRSSVYINETDPDNPVVGIEQAFDIVVTVTDANDAHLEARFIGTIDGVHFNPDREDAVPYIEENKTASRLNDAWSQSWHTSHQVTGYMIAASTIMQRRIDRGKVLGMEIPLPRTYDIGGIVSTTVSRTPSQFIEWARWFAMTATRYRVHSDDPLSAPMKTHSCNRFFYPCSLIPLCASGLDEQMEMLNEMEARPLSPSEEAILGEDEV